MRGRRGVARTKTSLKEYAVSTSSDFIIIKYIFSLNINGILKSIIFYSSQDEGNGINWFPNLVLVHLSVEVYNFKFSRTYQDSTINFDSIITYKKCLIFQ